MKGFKLTDTGDITIIDGQISMVSDTELEKQTIKTVLSTNKGESPFNENEGIDFGQILVKGVNKDMIRTQIQSGIKQVCERVIADFACEVNDSRHAVITFTARGQDDSSILIKDMNV